MSTWRERNPAAYREAWRRWYAKNAAKKVAWQARRRDELRAWLLALKSELACTGCGESSIECLQFHHVDATTKEIEVAKAIVDGWSKARILGEMQKCVVLCANCHLKHHWDERLAKL